MVEKQMIISDRARELLAEAIQPGEYFDNEETIKSIFEGKPVIFEAATALRAIQRALDEGRGE